MTDITPNYILIDNGKFIFNDQDSLTEYYLKPINKIEFNELCDRLSKHSDWSFDGSKKHFKKLAGMLSAY